mgnify:FL=1|jgi:hypothetical protein
MAAPAFRVFRDIYRIDQTSVYTLIDPYALSASVYTYGSGTFVESPIVSLSATGIYYVDLNLMLYTYDNIYEIFWYINYVAIAPQKILKTRFRFNPISINSLAESGYEIIRQPMEFEIMNSPIEIEIIR